MTMTADLLALLQRGWTSPLRALNEASCLSLSQRVGEMIRDGIPIEKRWLKLPNGKMVREYRIAPTLDHVPLTASGIPLPTPAKASALKPGPMASASDFPTPRTTTEDRCYFAEMGDAHRAAFERQHSFQHKIGPLI